MKLNELYIYCQIVLFVHFNVDLAIPDFFLSHPHFTNKNHLPKISFYILQLLLFPAICITWSPFSYHPFSRNVSSSFSLGEKLTCNILIFIVDFCHKLYIYTKMCFVKGGNNSFGNLFSDHKINDDILMRFSNLNSFHNWNKFKLFIICV